MKIEIEAKDMKKKVVKRHSNNVGYVYLPEDWIGKKVCVILEV